MSASAELGEDDPRDGSDDDEDYEDEEEYAYPRHGGVLFSGFGMALGGAV